jgi:hypothetical protein
MLEVPLHAKDKPGQQEFGYGCAGGSTSRRSTERAFPNELIEIVPTKDLRVPNEPPATTEKATLL